jgi:hypothetical protein
MSIIQEIQAWSDDQPVWQGDAMARLFDNGALSETDLEDLFAILKAEHGIEDPKKRIAKKLSAAQIPAPTVSGDQITLYALKDLANVNKIAEKQRLAFANHGLTVIYGDNGSGKSGYSRVLKRACRARDQKEPIHPNAYLPAGKTAAATATFEVSINGTPQELLWTDAQAAPDPLSSLAVCSKLSRSRRRLRLRALRPRHPHQGRRRVQTAQSMARRRARTEDGGYFGLRVP